MAAVKVCRNNIRDIQQPEQRRASNYVHRGSTSQDVLDSALMIVMGNALRLVREDLARAGDHAAATIDRFGSIPAAGRTLAMQAVPTTFGAKVAVWLDGLDTCVERIDELFARGLPAQLGGAAGTRAGYLEAGRADAVHPPSPATIDALNARFAELLGMRATPIPWHTNRIAIADIAHVLAVASGTMGKIATDVISQSRTEIGEVLEPAAPGRGASSAMPHKRNPAMSTMIRAAALQVPALVSTLHLSLIAEDERPAGAWHAEWAPLRDVLALVGGAAETLVELLAGLTADADRMAANLDLTGGQIVSERLAVSLATVLGKRRARQVLTDAAHEAQRTGRDLRTCLRRDPALAEVLGDDSLDVMMAPAGYTGLADRIAQAALARHRSGGPPSPTAQH